MIDGKKEKIEKVVFQLGNLALTAGVLLVTVVPLFLKHLDIIIMPVGTVFSVISFMFFCAGAFLYACSFSQVEEQFKWLFKLVIFFFLFQIIFRAYLDFGLVERGLPL
jgi:hypothetical protein